MTKSKLLILAAAPALVLCSCAKKCTFEEFQKKVAEINLDGVELESITVKGSFTINGKEYEVKKTKIDENTSASEVSVEAIEAAMIMEMLHVSEFAIVEDEKATYYAGSTFKVKTEEVTIEWDKYGMCTSIDGEYEGYAFDLTAKYRDRKSVV